MFQTLISDRKLLAKFYTLPFSACLLAELAVFKLDRDWGSRAPARRGLRMWHRRAAERGAQSIPGTAKPAATKPGTGP